MKMKMQTTVTIPHKDTTKKLRLIRRHNKLGEIISWEVLSEDKQFRYGVIRLRNDDYLTKRVGWQEFKVKYWMGSRFYPQKLVIAPTQKECLTRLLEN